MNTAVALVFLVACLVTALFCARAALDNLQERAFVQAAADMMYFGICTLIATHQLVRVLS